MLWLIKQCYLASISVQHFICAVSAHSQICSLNVLNCCLFYPQIWVWYPAEATLQPDKEHLVGKKTASVWEMDWITAWLAGSERQDKKKLSLSFSLLLPPPSPVCGSSPLSPPSLRITLAHRLSLFPSFPPSIFVQPLTPPQNKKRGKKRLECGWE